MDSAGVAALVAQGTFVALLAIAIGSHQVGPRATVAFVVLWLLGYVGLPRLSTMGGPLVTSYVAILDIILTFIVFKGDVRI